jgi:hypothetical protein
MAHEPFSGEWLPFSESRRLMSGLSVLRELNTGPVAQLDRATAF